MGWGCISLTVGCALQPSGMGSKSKSVLPAADWFSALVLAHWLRNKLAVTSAEAGASGTALPASKRGNSPSSMQEHPRFGGL